MYSFLKLTCASLRTAASRDFSILRSALILERSGSRFIVMLGVAGCV
jgi:hypothetical protein